jgi:hypothetical protein
MTEAGTKLVQGCSARYTWSFTRIEISLLLSNHLSQVFADSELSRVIWAIEGPVNELLLFRVSTPQPARPPEDKTLRPYISWIECDMVS